MFTMFSQYNNYAYEKTVCAHVYTNTSYETKYSVCLGYDR